MLVYMYDNQNNIGFSFNTQLTTIEKYLTKYRQNGRLFKNHFGKLDKFFYNEHVRVWQIQESTQNEKIICKHFKYKCSNSLNINPISEVPYVLPEMPK